MYHVADAHVMVEDAVAAMSYPIQPILILILIYPCPDPNPKLNPTRWYTRRVPAARNWRRVATAAGAGFEPGCRGASVGTQ